ncbi:ATP-grasp domain-containing protein [Dasania marina]|uniref:ATP-grasp domain-containing protein n=1 Tax=Dasania marina TaxID=471499 RepID=UPI0030DAB561|tara:strand:- start:26091 stop:27308 length:1218 start_codon:yes stop_codon:yes gene_type:complete
METLLIIGAGREQVPAYTLAKQKGYTVVGTDIDPNAPGLKVADHALICSARNVEQTLAVVSEFDKTHKINGVMTIANDVPYTVARVAEALGLPCAASTGVQRLTNKLHMKTDFQQAGVATPDFWPIETLAQLELQVQQLFPAPLILKPSDGRGSRGVLYLEQGCDLAWAFAHAMQSCANGYLILERFVAGPQLSVEGMFVGDSYKAVAYADRNYENMQATKPYIVEDGGIIPSRFEGELLEQIRDLIERGALALGLQWGTVKADIVLSEQGPEIIELAGRLSGNYLATHHIPMAYGIDLVGVLIDLCMGKTIARERLTEQHKKYLGVRYFFPLAGKITAIKHVDTVLQLPYVNMLDIYAQVGDMQATIDNHGARAGTIICEADNYQQAKQRVEDAVQAITFEVDS